MKIPEKKEVHAKVKAWLGKRSGSGFQPHDLTKLVCDIIGEVFAENVVSASADRRTLERYRGALDIIARNGSLEENALLMQKMAREALSKED